MGKNAVECKICKDIFIGIVDIPIVGGTNIRKKARRSIKAMMI